MRRDWAEFWEILGGVLLLGGFLVYSVTMRGVVSVTVAAPPDPGLGQAQLSAPSVTIPPGLLRAPDPKPERRPAGR